MKKVIVSLGFLLLLSSCSSNGRYKITLVSKSENSSIHSASVLLLDTKTGEWSYEVKPLEIAD